MCMELSYHIEKGNKSVEIVLTIKRIGKPVYAKRTLGYAMGTAILELEEAIDEVCESERISVKRK